MNMSVNYIFVYKVDQKLCGRFLNGYINNYSISYYLRKLPIACLNFPVICGYLLNTGKNPLVSLNERLFCDYNLKCSFFQEGKKGIPIRFA